MNIDWYLSDTISLDLLDEASDEVETAAKLEEAKLTPREKEILAMLLEYKKYKQIGEALGISAIDAKARGYKIRVKLRGWSYSICWIKAETEKPITLIAINDYDTINMFTDR